MKEQTLQEIALQAIGEHLMNHIADVMEMVQDKSWLHPAEELDEATLVIIEERVKTIAQALTYQSTKVSKQAESPVNTVALRKAFNELLSLIPNQSKLDVEAKQ